MLGVVIEVPQPWGEELQQWRLGFGDNTADHMPTHITLVAPTKVASGRLDGVIGDIDAVCASMSSFSVASGGIGTFRPTSPVVYLAIGEGSEQVCGLHESLLPLVSEHPPLHPFIPHITVAMHLPDAVLDASVTALHDYEVTWRVGSVSSFLRGRDGRWLRLAAHAFPG